MEYIEGQPIDQHCDRQQLSTVERIELFRQVCAAVQYAHQNLVVHRDIKPGNILVTSDGTPKLLDFGIAKLLNPELAQEVIAPTLSAMQLMTPGYASPEQVRGETITTASDVYSLGVVLYELLTGHRPYHVSSRMPHEIARVICEEEPARPSTAVTRVEVIANNDGSAKATITPESVAKSRGEQPEKLRRRLSGDLDNIVLMAMRKEPPRRYASAGQLAEDIRRHLEGLPVLARGDSLNYRTGKFIRRHKAGVAAALLVVLVVIAGFVATLWEARVARMERARAERRFNDVRRLANSFMFELHDAIEKLPGSTPAQSLLVKRALEYLDSLAGESAGDTSLQRELATAYEKVGDIQGNPYVPNLGDITGAVGSYQKALQIRQALPAGDLQTASSRLDLAHTYDRIGDVTELAQGAKAALGNYRLALPIRESLAAERAKDVQVLRDLSRSYENIGLMLVKTGDAAGAMEHFRKAVQINESLDAERPNDPQTRRNLAILYNKLSAGLAEAGAEQEAIAKARQSLAIFKSLEEANPNDARAQRELALAYNTLGNHCWDQKDFPCALENYQQGLKLRQELFAADPTNQQARRDLAYSDGNVGYVLVQIGKESDGLEHYRQCISNLEALAAASPNSTLALNDLAKYYAYFGDLWVTLGGAQAPPAKRAERWQVAKGWYQRSLTLYTEMRDRGLLGNNSVAVLDARKKDIAQCDEKLARLNGRPTPVLHTR
jgi:non-specific serine/threonine protein kinase/serine/threonine-protein kinase